MLRLSRYHPFFTAVLASVLLGGCATQQPKGKFVDVPTDVFMQLMSREAPKRLCDPDHSPFRRCFNLSAEQCTAVVNRVMPVCIKQVMTEMPPIINNEQGKFYGEKLGRCVGYRFLAADPTFLEKMQNCKIDTQ